MKEMYLGKIPFYYNLQKECHNTSGIPDYQKFTIIEDDNGVCTQKYYDVTDEYLNKAYRIGSNISGLMDVNDIGNKYAQDFLRYILKIVGDVKKKRILEIGCGTGYLLYLLKNKGAITWGGGTR